MARLHRATTTRPARTADAEAIRAIWNHEVLATDHTTDTEPRDLAAQCAWLAAHGDDHPVVVAVADDEVLGYGALSAYRPKPAFARTVEDSVYVKGGARGRGVGTMILAELLDRASERGHHSVIARITASNEASLALHVRHGFQRVGVERETAWKLGRWLDVMVLQLMVDRTTALRIHRAAGNAGAAFGRRSDASSPGSGVGGRRDPHPGTARRRRRAATR